jgi:hypothetical protein
LHWDSKGKPFRYFFDIAMSGECTCPSDRMLFDSMTGHFAKLNAKKSRWSACTNPIERLGEWAKCAYHGSFPDRRTVLLVLGGPGTGKTTVVNLVLNLYPALFRGQIAWGDSYPLGALEEETLIVDGNDMRVESKLTPAETLNLFEFKKGAMMARKGKAAFCFRHPDVMLGAITANYLEPKGAWKVFDLDALTDRCFEEIVLTDKIAEGADNSAKQRCPKCSAATLAWAAQDADPTLAAIAKKYSSGRAALSPCTGPPAKKRHLAKDEPDGLPDAAQLDAAMMDYINQVAELEQHEQELDPEILAMANDLDDCF